MSAANVSIQSFELLVEKDLAVGRYYEALQRIRGAGFRLVRSGDVAQFSRLTAAVAHRLAALKKPDVMTELGKTCMEVLDKKLPSSSQILIDCVLNVYPHSTTEALQEKLSLAETACRWSQNAAGRASLHRAAGHCSRSLSQFGRAEEHFVASAALGDLLAVPECAAVCIEWSSKCPLEERQFFFLRTVLQFLARGDCVDAAEGCLREFQTVEGGRDAPLVRCAVYLLLAVRKHSAALYDHIVSAYDPYLRSRDDIAALVAKVRSKSFASAPPSRMPSGGAARAPAVVRRQPEMGGMAALPGVLGAAAMPNGLAAAMSGLLSSLNSAQENVSPSGQPRGGGPAPGMDSLNSMLSSLMGSLLTGMPQRDDDTDDSDGDGENSEEQPLISPRNDEID